MKSIYVIIIFLLLVAGIGLGYYRLYYPDSPLRGSIILRMADNSITDTYKQMPEHDCGIWYSMDGHNGRNNYIVEKCFRNSYGTCSAAKIYWITKSDVLTKTVTLRILGSDTTNNCVVQTFSRTEQDMQTPVEWSTGCNTIATPLEDTCR